MTGLEASAEELVGADLPFAAVDLPPPRLVRLVATRAAWRPVGVEIFAVPPHPEEEAAKIAARVRAFERHVAEFLGLASHGSPALSTPA